MKKTQFALLFNIFVSLLFSAVVQASEKLNVLIFSAPFGSGHNTAANRMADVLRDHYKEQGIEIEVKIKNTLEFSPKIIADISLKQFSAVQSNMPIVYSALFEHYMNGAHKVEHAGQMKLYKQLFINPKNIDHYIVNEAFADSSGKPVVPDLMISTWPGSTEALIALRHNEKALINNLGKKIPLAHVQTDNAAGDKYFQLFAQDVLGRNGADVVYVPSREVFDEYANKLGFKNIVFTGMPLKLKGKELSSYEQRAEDKSLAKQELGLPEKNKTIMIEAGKNGATNYAVIIASLVKSFAGEQINVIAAFGDSEKQQKILGSLEMGAARGTKEFNMLMGEMKELYQPKTIKNFLKKGTEIFRIAPLMTRSELEALIEKGVGRDIVLLKKGYVPLEPLRAASDIVITKPGGLSTAELGAEGRPMIILQEYASGEALPNGPLFEKKNLAIINNDISWIGKQTAELAKDEVKLRNMYRSSEKFRQDFELAKVIPFVENVRLENGKGQQKTVPNYTEVFVKAPLELSCSRIFAK